MVIAQLNLRADLRPHSEAIRVGTRAGNPCRMFTSGKAERWLWVRIRGSQMFLFGQEETVGPTSEIAPIRTLGRPSAEKK
jgi:hypothetical protein